MLWFLSGLQQVSYISCVFVLLCIYLWSASVKPLLSVPEVNGNAVFKVVGNALQL